MHIKTIMALVFVLILSVLPTAADQDQFEKVFRDLENEISTYSRNGDEQKEDFDVVDSNKRRSDSSAAYNVPQEPERYLPTWDLNEVIKIVKEKIADARKQIAKVEEKEKAAGKHASEIEEKKEFFRTNFMKNKNT